MWTRPADPDTAAPIFPAGAVVGVGRLRAGDQAAADGLRRAAVGRQGVGAVYRGKAVSRLPGWSVRLGPITCRRGRSRRRCRTPAEQSEAWLAVQGRCEPRMLDTAGSAG